MRRRVQIPSEQTEAVMTDRQVYVKKLYLKVSISTKYKGKALSVLCVASPCLNGLETIALCEQQQRRRQICKNNGVRRIAAFNDSGSEKDGGCTTQGERSQPVMDSTTLKQNHS